MDWLFLIVGIVLEVSGITSMKLSHGFTYTVPSVFMFILYGLALTFVSLALRKIDISIAYAIWSGLGTILVATIGALYFRESFSLLKLISVVLIIIGVIGLRASSQGQ